MVDFLQEEFWWLQRLGRPIAGQVRIAVSCCGASLDACLPSSLSPGLVPAKAPPSG
jgi:hypothetical protein